MRYAIPNIRWLTSSVLGLLVGSIISMIFLLFGVLSFGMATDSNAPVALVAFVLLGVFCVACGVVFLMLTGKFLFSLLGASLFAVGVWYLYSTLTAWGGEPGSQDGQSILYAVGFLAVLGLPGLVYALKSRFGFSTRRADLDEINDLIDRRYLEAATDAERSGIMGKILPNYDTYHEAWGHDAGTWSKIASILEEDYETHWLHVETFRRDHVKDPKRWDAITPLVRELSVGRPSRPVPPGDSGDRPGVNWIISFKGTIRELLRVEQQKRRQAKTRLIFWYVRAAPVILGFLWVIWMANDFDYGVLWIWVGFICLQVIYSNAIRPLFVRRRIRREFPADGEFEIEVGTEGFFLRTYDSLVEKNWDEVSEISHANQGLVFRWTDGIKHWLPGHLKEKNTGV